MFFRAIIIIIFAGFLNLRICPPRENWNIANITRSIVIVCNYSFKLMKNRHKQFGSERGNLLNTHRFNLISIDIDVWNSGHNSHQAKKDSDFIKYRGIISQIKTQNLLILVDCTISSSINWFKICHVVRKCDEGLTRVLLYFVSTFHSSKAEIANAISSFICMTKNIYIYEKHISAKCITIIK